jgi:hypothetical protein
MDDIQDENGQISIWTKIPQWSHVAMVGKE